MLIYNKNSNLYGWRVGCHYIAQNKNFLQKKLSSSYHTAIAQLGPKWLWPLYKWKKIVWIIGFMVFKSTGSISRFQCKHRFWKICTSISNSDSHPLIQKSPHFELWTFWFSVVIPSIFGLSPFCATFLFLIAPLSTIQWPISHKENRYVIHEKQVWIQKFYVNFF